MTLGDVLTLYRIRRDHSNRSQLFAVCVPEVRQYGFGVQIRIAGTLYGISIHTRRRPRHAAR